jgi:hypothetical protein
MSQHPADVVDGDPRRLLPRIPVSSQSHFIASVKGLSSLGLGCHGDVMQDFDPGYAADRLFEAARHLSLPHHDERRSILDAFHEFSSGIPAGADLGNDEWNRTKERVYVIMDIDRAQDLEARLWVRAGQLSFEERKELSRGILELLVVSERLRSGQDRPVPQE